MQPIPTDPLQEFLKVAGMSAADATRVMEAHQLITIEHMLFFCPRKAQDHMNIYNGQQTRQTNKFRMAV